MLIAIFEFFLSFIASSTNKNENIRKNIKPIIITHLNFINNTGSTSLSANNIITKKAELMQKSKELSKENHSLQTKVIELQAIITNLQEKQRGTTVG